MKNVFVRLISLILCVPFVLGLVACNGSGDAKTEPGTTTAESPDPTDPTPTDTDPTPTETEPAGTTGGEDEPTDPTKGPLDGKRVIFIGNSYVYYGQSVLSISKSTLKQPPRENDQGYFYQMCKAYGSEVNVTNWTFGSHALYDLFGGDCTINGCTAGNHEKYLTNRYYDYVFVSPSGGTTSEARIAEDFDYIINFFKAANPNVKIVCLGNLGCRGYSSWGLDLPGIYNYYKTLEEKGVIIADWGGIVKGLIDGKYTIDGSKETYSAKSFIVKDGYHPNQLAGYITTLTAYCAITGESAVGKTYDFCNNTKVHSRFSFSDYIADQYNKASDTNYPAIFASKTDMEGIQKLVDQYLTEKPYLNIETPKEDETTEKGPLDGKRVIFIGNSYIYYGYSCLGGSASTLDQSKRENDRGYFYQLCKAYGSEVNVTNWTAASHSLSDFFGGKCSRSSCSGKDHTASLTNAYYDYVFVAPSGGKQAEADNLLTDFDNIIKFFTAANPNVKIVCLGNLGCHGYSSSKLELPDMPKAYKTLEGKGVIIADYGSLIDDIIDGKVAVPGATQTYNKNSFILKNGYNPNLLTGYITTLMAYCAITGESAVGKTYAFCNDSSINTKFNFDTYVGNNYSSTITTNFPAIFASESDMKGIQELINKYLAEKPYRNYN